MNVQYQEFVAAHAAGTLAARIDGVRAALLLERRPDLPLTLGDGYRWQRLNFVSCIVCGLALLLGLPLWACLASALVGLVLRDWGIVTGGLFAVFMVWWGEYLTLTGWLCLALSSLYLWQGLRAARRELARLVLAEPATYEAAIDRRALTVEPVPAA